MICGKSFITAYKCGLHYKSKHLYESQWTCSKCGKLLTSQSNLDVHMQSHSKFKCFYCNKISEDKSAHKSHLKKHQRWLKAHESLKCKSFVIGFLAGRDGCLKHQKLCVKNPDRRVTYHLCLHAKCGKRFPQLKHLNYHVKSCPFRPGGPELKAKKGKK